MALVEICNSTYPHLPLYQFGKRYLKHRFKDKIICEECLYDYHNEVSDMLSTEIFNCINHVDMMSMINNHEIPRNDSLSFTFEKTLLHDFMKYILPIKFELYIHFTYEEIIRHIDTNYLEAYSSISTASNKPLTSIRIARATIKPIVCDSSYPSFSMTLDIRKDDTQEIIGSQIYQYMTSFIDSFFTDIPDNAVIALMDSKNSPAYASSATASSPKCSTCNSDAYFENYIYKNNVYCLNCMYAIVVKAAVDANISNEIGLSVDVNNTSTYAIVNSQEYKRSAIDKYIAVMKSFGANPNISHCMITVTG